MKYTVVSMYLSSEQVVVDHVEADNPAQAVSRTKRVVAQPLCVFEGHHTDLYTSTEEEELARYLEEQVGYEDRDEYGRDPDEVAEDSERTQAILKGE